MALTPETARRYGEAGFDVAVESGAGVAAGYSDSAYETAGARVTDDRRAGLAEADLVVQVRALGEDDISVIRKGAISISFLDPFRQPERVRAMAAAGVQAVGLEFMPRTTLAQKMDALSSQASLAGYAAVLLAASRLDRIFPMMMTPAGTLQPARVFVVGVGVAGLQAIATAKRLGARVLAFDTRPVVEEQVRSLGAKFLKIDLGETGQTAHGYASELTPEQIEQQKRGMAKACADSDVVITTAQVFGRPAPRLLTKDMVAGMRPGSLILDLAASTGGNVEGAPPDGEAEVAGVRIFGCSNLPATVPQHASDMFAHNVLNLVFHFSDPEKTGVPVLDGDDEILRGCVLTRNGEVVHERVRTLLD